jgi:hypothetical protein
MNCLHSTNNMKTGIVAPDRAPIAAQGGIPMRVRIVTNLSSLNPSKHASSGS